MKVTPVQVPSVEGIGRDAALLYEAESEEVVIARDTFASLRQYLVTLQEEVRRGKALPDASAWQILSMLASNLLQTSCTLHLLNGVRSRHALPAEQGLNFFKILLGVISIGRMQTVRVRHDNFPLRHSSHQNAENRLLEA